MNQHKTFIYRKTRTESTNKICFYYDERFWRAYPRSPKMCRTVVPGAKVAAICVSQLEITELWFTPKSHRDTRDWILSYTEILVSFSSPTWNHIDIELLWCSCKNIPYPWKFYPLCVTSSVFRGPRALWNSSQREAPTSHLTSERLTAPRYTALHNLTSSTSRLLFEEFILKSLFWYPFRL